jgi:hypothetical protein
MVCYVVQIGMKTFERFDLDYLMQQYEKKFIELKEEIFACILLHFGGDKV